MLGNALVALLDRDDIILPLDGGPETTSSAMAEEIIGKLLQSAGSKYFTLLDFCSFLISLHSLFF